jgi:malonate transporter MadM subunit
MLHMLEKELVQNGLVTSFALVGLIMWVSSLISRKLTFGRVHGSAIAIVIGLVLAWLGGVFTGGQKGLADLPLFTGVGLMGGAMLRDFAIVATAFEVQANEARKAGLIGAVSLLLGTLLPFIVGARSKCRPMRRARPGSSARCRCCSARCCRSSSARASRMRSATQTRSV